MDKQSPAIQAQRIAQSFKVGAGTIQVLKPASFTIEHDTFTVVFGPSGSGKSTLLNVITGLQMPSHGVISFSGQDIYKLEPDALAHFRASSIGFVYQQNYWVQSLTALENVALPLSFLGYSRLKANRRARQMLALVGMSKAANRHPALLSGGEQQRVAVARAIINSPKFIVADEPTGNLDSANGDMVMQLLRHSQRDLHRTVILVTHNMEYLSMADNMLHIKDGRIRQIPRNEIKPTTEGLLSALRGRIENFASVKSKPHHTGGSDG